MFATSKKLPESAAHSAHSSPDTAYEPQSGVTLAAKALNGDAMIKPLLEEVTLVVYGWKSVEPGTLAWVFPSLGAAIAAAHTMRNAVRWAIVRGRRGESANVDVNVDEERGRGAVLVEQHE
jgi:hypothetical protein